MASSIRVCVFPKVILPPHVPSQTCSVSLILLLFPTMPGYRIRHKPAPIHGAVHGLAEWLNRAPSQVVSPGPDRDLQRAHAGQLPFKKEQSQHRHLNDVPTPSLRLILQQQHAAANSSQHHQVITFHQAEHIRVPMQCCMSLRMMKP